MGAEAMVAVLTIFILSVFLGFQIITKVPPLLHTPLMAFTNAIDGISVVASIIVAGAGHNKISTILGTIAVAAATINLVGGFLITDRMLNMFKREKPQGKKQ